MPPPLTTPVSGKLSGWSSHQHLARCRGSRKTCSRARLPPPLPPPAGALAAGGPAHWALGQAKPRKAIAALARPISRSNGASSGKTSARAAPPGVTAAVKKTQCSCVADPDNHLTENNKGARRPGCTSCVPPASRLARWQLDGCFLQHLGVSVLSIVHLSNCIHHQSCTQS